MGFAPIILAELPPRPPGIDFILLAVLLYSAYYFANGLLAYLKRMSIRNLPTAKARSAAVGMAELHGKAKPISRPLISPILGFKCVYYAVILEEKKRAKHSSQYVEIKNARIESTAPFLLEDETGTITVDPKGASILIQHDMQREGPFSSFYGKAKDFVGQALDKQPILDRFINLLWPLFHFPTGKYRIREFTISPGDEIYVFGNAKIPESQPTYEISNSLVLSKGEPWQDFILADHSEEKVKGGLFYPMILGSIAFINILLCILSFGAYIPCIATGIGILTIILIVEQLMKQPSLGKAL